MTSDGPAVVDVLDFGGVKLIVLELEQRSFDHELPKEALNACGIVGMEVSATYSGSWALLYEGDTVEMKACLESIVSCVSTYLIDVSDVVEVISNDCV